AAPAKKGATKTTTRAPQRAAATSRPKRVATAPARGTKPARDGLPPRPTQLPEWQALVRHKAKIEKLHLRQLFADDPERGRNMTLEAGDIYFDSSKNLITYETLRLLRALAERSNVRDGIRAMFAG